MKLELRPPMRSSRAKGSEDHPETFSAFIEDLDDLRLVGKKRYPNIIAVIWGDSPGEATIRGKAILATLKVLLKEPSHE